MDKESRQYTSEDNLHNELHSKNMSRPYTHSK